MIRKRDLRDIYISENVKVTIDLEDVKKEIANQFYNPLRVGNIIKWLNQDIDCMIAFYASYREYGVFGDCYINSKIHRAINKQCQELWCF